MSVSDSRPFTGRKFLSIMVAAFLLVSAVNGAMIWLGLRSWPGLVSDSAYQEGLGFDKVLAAGRAEALLGWRAEIAYDDRAGLLTVALADAQGRALSGLDLSARWLRPTSEGQDRDVALRETAVGRYSASFRPPLAGVWDVRLAMRERGQVRFHAEKRVVVAP